MQVVVDDHFAVLDLRKFAATSRQQPQKEAVAHLHELAL